MPAAAASYADCSRGSTVDCQASSDRAVLKEGVPREQLAAAYAYMQTRPGDLQAALQDLLHKRDLTGFRVLARAFKGRR